MSAPLNQLDADFLKISHLEARMRGESDQRFADHRSFLSDPFKNDKNPHDSQFFDGPTIDILHYENFSSNEKKLKRKGFFSGNENFFDSFHESQGQQKGADRETHNLLAIRKKIKGEFEIPCNLIERENSVKKNNETKENHLFLVNGQPKIIHQYPFELNCREIMEENRNLKAKFETLQFEFEVVFVI